MSDRCLPVETFLNRVRDIPLFDVRSPSEFLQGHIPGAHNLPLFADEERHTVGRTYHEQGRDAAILTGLELVGPRMRSMVETVRAVATDGRVALTCWRGGMRSESVAWLLGFSGMDVVRLDGGYKAFRRWVLDSFAVERPIIVLSGATGSGKTAILDHLRRAGEQVIDLEGLAHHKGSAFGSLGEPPPPSQEQFENRLAAAWRAMDPARPVWLEDESRRIGRRNLPQAFWEQMRAAPVMLLEMPVHLRVERLLADYGSFSAASLGDAIQRLHKRLGGVQTREALSLLDRGDLAGCCELLLRAYYDKAYRHGLRQRDPATVDTVETDSLDPAENARRVLSRTGMEKRPDSRSRSSGTVGP